jgi:hypothetical protein
MVCFCRSAFADGLRQPLRHREAECLKLPDRGSVRFLILLVFPSSAGDSGSGTTDPDARLHRQR